MINITLTPKQLSAVEMMKQQNVGILTGGPGTGKTTAVKEILQWAFDSGVSVIQCAPTGKAAKRMEEATGHGSTTIHRTLGATMDNGNFVFSYNELLPLDCDLLVIDEVSMVDNELMSNLLRAINESRTKILFVGDQGQLPSVGAGAVLRDLLSSGCIPHVELTQIHRNSGEIVKSCHEIHKGKHYLPCTTLDPDNGLNLRHIEASTPQNILEIIKMLIIKMNDREYDPVWDVQVLSPTNMRTDLSCESINTVLQNQLNQKNPKIEGSIFRINDKVIQTKNMKIETTDGDATHIVNGDMGQVVDIDNAGAMIVNFLLPDRKVKIPKLNKLLLAYCITCHRAQGSEMPVVIIPVHKSFGFFVNRSWIYTAISRASDICFTVGQFQAIERAINRQDSQVRKTFLKEKIIERVTEEI